MEFRVGDKFVIEVDSVFFRRIVRKDKAILERLYGIKGFNTLVFDDRGLERLKVYQGDEVAAIALRNEFKARAERRKRKENLKKARGYLHELIKIRRMTESFDEEVIFLKNRIEQLEAENEEMKKNLILTNKIIINAIASAIDEDVSEAQDGGDEEW